MRQENYNVNIVVNATPRQVTESINNISKWWTEDVDGQSEKVNDVFTVRFGETFITIKIVELIPDKKICWHVIDCYKHWLKDKKEWKDTKMDWAISSEKNETRISFTHIGLVPAIECYDGCEKAWDHYIKVSLLKSITKGKEYLS